MTGLAAATGSPYPFDKAETGPYNESSRVDSAILRRNGFPRQAAEEIWP